MVCMRRLLRCFAIAPARIIHIIHTVIHVERTEVDIDDDRALRALVARVGLPHLDFTGWNAPPDRYLDRYLYQVGPTFHWRSGTDHWFAESKKQRMLGAYVISGLMDEQEAKLLRQWWCREFNAAGPIEQDDLQRLAERLEAERSQRARAKTFESALRRIRTYFDHDGQMPKLQYNGAPPPKLNLPDDDMDLLREVARRLPEEVRYERYMPEHSWADPKDVKIAPEKRQRDALRPKIEKKVRAARQRAKARKNIGDEGLKAWLDDRLTDFNAVGVWSRPKPLYDDYVNWTQNRPEGQTMTDYREVKASPLSIAGWGRAMSRVVQKRRDGSNNWYNVRLKGQRLKK